VCGFNLVPLVKGLDPDLCRLNRQVVGEPCLLNSVFVVNLLQVGDMDALGIFEAFKVKQAVILSATEAAEMILRVDEIIKCAPRQREDRM
jgi:hypothetical protein